MFIEGKGSSSLNNLNQLASFTHQPIRQTQSFNSEEKPTTIRVAATQRGASPSVLEAKEFKLTTTSSFTVHSPLRSPNRLNANPTPLNLDGRVFEITEGYPPPNSSAPGNVTLHRHITSFNAPSSPVQGQPSLSIQGQQPLYVTHSAPPPYYPPPAGLPVLNLDQQLSVPGPHRSSAPAVLRHSNSVDVLGRLVAVSVAGPANVNGYYHSPIYPNGRHHSPSVAPFPNGLAHHSSPSFPPNGNGHLAEPILQSEAFELSYYDQFVNSCSCSPEMALAALAFFVKFTLSMIAGGASALNATVNPSGAQPSNIGQEWWDSLSTALAFYCLLNGGASLIVNYVFAYTSIPTAALKIRKNLLKYPQNKREIIENGITITLGTSAAVATAAIAYNAFTWTKKYTGNEAIADIVTVASLAINFTTRYVGVRSLLNFFHAYTDEELILKKELSDDLANIQADYKETMQTLLEDAFNENNHLFNEDTLVRFINKIIDTQDPDFINVISPAKARLHKALHGLEVLFAATIGLAALPTFIQLGFNGINILATKCGYEELGHLDRHYRGLIGLTPGVATAMLYAISTLDLPRLLVNIVKELNEERRAWPMFLFAVFLVFNILASGSMQNVAEGVESKEDRIFDFLSLSTFLGVALVWLNRLGGGITNAKASFQKLFGSPSLTDPKLGDVNKWMHDINIDNRFKPDTVSTLLAYSQFRRRRGDVVVPDGYAPLADQELEQGAQALPDLYRPA